MNEFEVAKFGADMRERMVDALSRDAKYLGGATRARHGGFDDAEEVIKRDVAGAATEHQVSVGYNALGGKCEGFGVFLDGAFFVFFGVGHGGGIDDHDIPTFLWSGEKVEDISAKGLVEMFGEIIAQPVLVCGIDGCLGDIDAHHLGCSPTSRIHGESACVAKEIEDAQALAHLAQVLAVFALIEEKAGLLAFEDIDQEGHAQLADRDGG